MVSPDEVPIALDQQRLAVRTIGVLQISDLARQVPRVDEPQACVAATIAGGSAASTGTVATNLGYPENSTLFYPVLLYQQAFLNFNMGYASAIAMLLLFVSFAVVLAIVLNSKRFVHFQAGGR